MKLGAFSISLSVKDIIVSRDFYLNLGFEEMAGDVNQKWLIMHNDDTVIGLFQDMLKNNILTFNPGWNQKAEELKDFEDIRSIREVLKAKGISIENEVDQGGEGSASFMVTDPDGNTILFDQHR